MAIYDLDSHVILTAELALSSGEETTASILIDCVTGYFLSGESVDTLTVEARHGNSGSWTDIETGTLDLSTWNGSRELFQIRLVAGSVTTYQRRSFSLTVSR